MRAQHFFVGLIIFGASHVMALAGDIYSYTDNEGVIHFSNYPHNAQYQRIPDLSTNEALTIQPERKAISLHAYNSIIKNTAVLYSVDEALLHAVIKTESGYNTNAVSPKGAVGLMQLMPATAKRYGVIDSKDPTQNVQGGTRYLKDLLKKFNNNLHLVLAAYNAGEMAVARHGNALPPYRETQRYVPQVLNRYQAYSGCTHYPC